MKTAARKRNIPMYAAGVLLCLTLLSLHMVSGLFAKYTTTGTATDSARVASFYLEAEGRLMQNLEAEIIPGDTLQQDLQIINNTEVKMEYTLKIQREDNIPLILSLNNTDTSAVYSPQNGTITVVQTLPPGEEKTDHYTLEISWPESHEEIDPNLAYIGEVDYLRVTVDAVQID